MQTPAPRLRRQRRARRASQTPAEIIGFTEGEVVRLRAAVVRAVDNLSDRQLRLSGDRWFALITDRAHLFGMADEFFMVPDTAGEYVAAVRDLAEQLRALDGDAPVTDLDRRLNWLAQTLDLDTIETAILAIFARCRLFEPWRDLISTAPFRRGEITLETLTILSGLPASKVDLCLIAGSRLLQTGLIQDDRDGEFRGTGLLARIASTQTTDPAELSARMMPPAPCSTLHWDDFDHVGALRDFAHDLLAAGRRGEAVSILLHGLPGTGKTEFARALADRLSFTAVFAGQGDGPGGEPDRADRLAHLAILRALTRGKSDRLIVVDEADDMLVLGQGRARQGASKLWLNMLVEAPVTPTIWIVNDPDNLGPSILRRMSLAIEFSLPPRAVRERIVDRQARLLGLAGGTRALVETAALPIAPAVLANALRAAHVAGGDPVRARLAGESILLAQGERVPPCASLPLAYDAALARADHDLDALTARLSRTPERKWSLLLCGPSGTGKSAFARHLAERIGIEVDEQRGSELLSRYVGGTEAAIAAAFRRSAENGTLLLIDEIDNFLFDRRDAQRSWEISMVNEMLRWMDALGAPFVATTNLAETLDPAVQRRFAMRMCFRPLSAEQAVRQFERWFSQAPPLDVALADLTPGDFAVVAARAKLMGASDPRQLAHWLVSEAAMRGASVAIGFHRPAQVD